MNWGEFHPDRPQFEGTGQHDLYWITAPLNYRDPYKVIWTCPAGMLVDGESIPRCLWWLTGHPFQQPGMMASIIHDAYCVLRTRPSSQVHLCFYHALRAEGVPAWKAHLRYWAVRLFGPRWPTPEEI